MRYVVIFFASLLFVCVDSHAQSQAEMNAAALADLENADAKLNSVYKRIISQNAKDTQFCNALREAQRAWLKFVELHLKTVFPLKDGENPREVYGSIYPQVFATEKASLIEERIQQLGQLNLLK